MRGGSGGLIVGMLGFCFQGRGVHDRPFGRARRRLSLNASHPTLSDRGLRCFVEGVGSAGGLGLRVINPT